MLFMPCLQGCTWNPERVQQAASVIARESRASGIDRGFSPVLHFCTDPRFGRCEESFGEDPMLISRMGEAAVTGLAGPGGPGAASMYSTAAPAAYGGYGYGQQPVDRYAAKTPAHTAATPAHGAGYATTPPRAAIRCATSSRAR